VARVAHLFAALDPAVRPHASAVVLPVVAAAKVVLPHHLLNHLVVNIVEFGPLRQVRQG
jgi:hypothetical protein